MKKLFLGLLLIFLLAASLRVYDLGKESIWMDEAFAVEGANQASVSAVVGWVRSFDPIPPLYYVALHFWVKLFGTSETALRSLSVLFNLLTLPFFFLVAKRLFGNKAALLAAVLFATSMLQVQYSQEARSYAMFSFLAWLSSWLFMKIVADKKKYYAHYVFVSALAIYTNQLMLLVMFLQASAYALLTNREKIRAVLLSQAAVVALFAPWLPVFYKQVFLVNTLFRLNLVNRFHLPQFIGQVGGFWLVIAFFVGLAIFLIVYLRKREWLNRLISEKLFLALAAIMLVGYIALLPALIRSFFLIRYFFFLLPLAYLFIAAGLGIVKSRRLRFAVVAAFVLLNCFALYTYYSEATKPEWRQAVHFIDSSSSEGEAAVFDTGFSKIIYEYYNGQLEEFGSTERNAGINDSKEYLAQVMPELRQKKGVWLALYRNFVTKDFYVQELEKSFRLVLSTEDYAQLQIYHFTQP